MKFLQSKVCIVCHIWAQLAINKKHKNDQIEGQSKQPRLELHKYGYKSEREQPKCDLGSFEKKDQKCYTRYVTPVTFSNCSELSR